MFGHNFDSLPSCILRLPATLTIAALAVGLAAVGLGCDADEEAGAPDAADTSGGSDAAASNAAEVRDAATVPECVQDPSDPCAQHMEGPDCVAAPECELVYGRSGASATSRNFTFRGCRSASLECTPTTIYGREPGSEHRCVQFEDTCLPPGWECVGSEPCPAYCQGANLTRCEDAEECSPIFGRRQLQEEAEFAGCISSPDHCDDAITCGRGSDDTCREYADTCLPAGVEPVACDAPGCPDEPVAAMLEDCRVQTAIEHLAGDADVEFCGLIEPEATAEEREIVEACIEESQAQGQAFRASERMSGTDSISEDVTLGLIRDEQLWVYALRFSTAPLIAGTRWHVSHVIDLDGDCPEAGDACVGPAPEDSQRCRCETAGDDDSGFVFCVDLD